MRDGFSTEWDTKWKLRDTYTRYPWSKIVSYTMRFVEDTSDLRVLEIGCGPGPNIGFFLDLDAKYYGIDGSETALEIARDRFPSVADHLIQGDFTEHLPEGGPYDLIVDRSALTHNTTADITKTVSMIHESLVGDGWFISVDNFADDDQRADWQNAEKVDEYTRRFDEGYFEQKGDVHFWDREHIEHIYDNFDIKRLYHETREELIPDNQYNKAWYHVLARPDE